MAIKRLLILEDDLETLALLLTKLHQLEEKLAIPPQPISIAVTVLSEYDQVINYINPQSKTAIDIILLDRDCKKGGSFHILDINKFGSEKIIGISSIPQYNQQLMKRGVITIIQKDYSQLNNFAEKVTIEIKNMISQ
jgi:hypothetical protein